MKKLRHLLKDLQGAVIRGAQDNAISGLCSNSKVVAPGNLFIAKKGLTVDGSRFIPDAIQAGAVAVLTDLYNPFLPGHVTQIIHHDVVHAETVLASAYYDNPSQDLFLVGITGTNGKTTTSFLIRHILREIKSPCGLIGTVEWDLGEKIQSPFLTTPDCITNCRLLREMLKGGCKSAVMEVSSQAMDQGRVRNLHFDVGIFTNLTQDHLDYHHTMENYADAKAKFFKMLGDKTAIINADSPWSSRMVEGCSAKVMTYGIENPADLKADNVHLDSQGITFDLSYQGKILPVKSILIGRFNVYNILGAIGAALVYGMPLEEIVKKVASFQKVPGRLERIENLRGISVFVDYAHSDDALSNVLTTLREVTKGRVMTVFGCGGDRDRGKRPLMGAVATKLSDFTVITSDNPRHEDPQAIIAEILQGCVKKDSILVEPDRKNAIISAIAKAQCGDTILIAGKGHERQQIFGSRIVDFDDCEIAREELNK